jgi:hypothetical protein
MEWTSRGQGVAGAASLILESHGRRVDLDKKSISSAAAWTAAQNRHLQGGVDVRFS